MRYEEQGMRCELFICSGGIEVSGVASLHVRDEGKDVRDEGREVRDEGREVRDEGQGVRDEGQGERDEGQECEGQG